MSSVADIGSDVYTGTGGQPLQHNDWLTYLVNDHNTFRSLIARAEVLLNAPTADIAGIKTIMNEIVREVSQHTSIEEQHLYELYYKYNGQQGRSWYDESLKDDQRDKQYLSFLEKTDPAADLISYRTKAAEFFSTITKHMTMEETLYWPAMKTAIPTDVQAALLGKLINARKSAPVHPHPEGPNHAGLAKIMHPVVGAVEKMLGMGGNSGSTSAAQASGQGSKQL